MRGHVSVLGAGIGSLTAASLLARQGWDIVVGDAPRRPPPALVLNEIAQRLLDDVFGPGLLDDGHLIEDRRARWGPGSAEAVVATRSVAIDGAVLLARLRSRISADEHPRPAAGPTWVIDGTGRESQAGARTAFGRRCVVQAQVSLFDRRCRTSWTETVADGWVHLAPLSSGRGVVQAMVPVAPADPASALMTMIAATDSIRRQVAGGPDGARVLPAAPGISSPVCAPGRISVADAAVSVDPISGFGTAWALRGGILAAAVIDAVSSGLPEDECLGHYSDRLREAVAAHVDHCLRLYGAAFSSPAWKEELALMASARLAEGPRRPPTRFGYRLNGFRLERQPAGRT